MSDQQSQNRETRPDNRHKNESPQPDSPSTARKIKDWFANHIAGTKGGVHTVEKVANGAFDWFGMLILTLYGPVLVYVAAVWFVPKTTNAPVATLPIVGELAWNEVLCWIITIVVTAVHGGMKRVPLLPFNKESVRMIVKLVVRSVLVVLGWVFLFFGNPWSNPVPEFSVPDLAAMLANPVFVVILLLILVDTWQPSFLRKLILSEE